MDGEREGDRKQQREGDGNRLGVRVDEEKKSFFPMTGYDSMGQEHEIEKEMKGG